MFLSQRAAVQSFLFFSTNRGEFNNMTMQSGNEQLIPLFSVAFRPFFLSGALFSLVAMSIWGAVLSGWLTFEPYGSSFWWHAHEMLFGFTVAIIVGFLLTAVQNWTGLTSVKGKSLGLLWLLWLIARVLLAIDIGLADWVIVFIDLAFLPVVCVVMARLIITVKLWRNLIFIPILVLMTCSNALMHWGLLNNNAALINQGSYAMVMLVVMLITVLGGRVFPMFTANGTGTKKVEGIRILEILTIASTALIALIYITGITLPALLQAVLLLLSALCHFIRLIRWRFWVTFKTPLVWSLHLGYLGIPIGFFLMALHYFSGDILLSTVVHALTVGAIGSTILSMITRVSLGHTGRKLIVGKALAIAFILVFLTSFVRVFYTLISDDYSFSMATAALMWVLAYGIYSVIFLPKLITKRL